MVLQEREKLEVVLTPEAAAARKIDLNRKRVCWETDMEIARGKRDRNQVIVAAARLRDLEMQINLDTQIKTI